MWINNAWEVIRKSAVTWLGQILGYAMIFYGYVLNSSADIQTTVHFAAWQNWVPWVAGLAIAFGIPVARGVAQKSVQVAANK
jgi:hypothetical protein